MSKSSSESFVLEFPLKIYLVQEKELEKRFEACRHLYNACLGEALKRLSRLWNKARSLPKTKEHNKERKTLFSQAQREHNFSEYSLHSFVKEIRKNWWFKDVIRDALRSKYRGKKRLHFFI